MEINFPPAQLGSTTPAADTVAGVVGTALTSAHADHAHQSSSIYLGMQNAADQGHKFQRVATSSIVCNSAIGAVWTGAIAVSWAATFATTPTAMLAVGNGSTHGWTGGMGSITSTGGTASAFDAVNGNSQPLEIWAIG